MAWAPVIKYSEDEARDSHGRWTATGDSSVRGALDRGYSEFKSQGGSIATYSSPLPREDAAKLMGSVQDLYSKLEASGVELSQSDKDGFRMTMSALQKGEQIKVVSGRISGSSPGDGVLYVATVKSNDGKEEVAGASYVYHNGNQEHLDYIGSTHMADGAGSAMVNHIYDDISSDSAGYKSTNDLYGTPLNSDAASFWQRMGWKQDKQFGGGSMYDPEIGWGITGEQMSSIMNGTTKVFKSMNVSDYDSGHLRDAWLKAKAEKVWKPVLVKYNSNEARNERGEWTSEENVQRSEPTDVYSHDDVPESVSRAYEKFDPEEHPGAFENFTEKHDFGSGCDDIGMAVENKFGIPQVFGTYTTTDGKTEGHSWNQTSNGWIFDASQYVFNNKGEGIDRPFVFEPGNSSQYHYMTSNGSEWLDMVDADAKKTLGNDLSKYSPDQARDSDGRFASGSGSNAAAGLTPQRIGEAIDEARQGGFTLDPRNGHTPTTGFQVGGHAEPLRIATDSTPEEIAHKMQQFLEDNKELYKDNPKMYLGGWIQPAGNGREEHLCIEPSFNVGSKQAAFDLGKQLNQISIWDVKNFEEHNTGGTGEFVGR